MAAANESQGLKIAVAAFVTLTVILAVATYFAYDSYSQASVKLAAAEKDRNDAKAVASQEIGKYDFLRERAGYAKVEDHTALQEAMKKDDAKLAEQLTEINNTIKKLVDGYRQAGGNQEKVNELSQAADLLVNEITTEPNQTSQQRIDRMTRLLGNVAMLSTQLSLDNEALRASLATVDKANSDQLNVQVDAAKKASKDLEDEHTKHEMARSDLIKKYDDLQNLNSQQATELTRLNQQIGQMKDDYGKQRENLLAQLRSYRQQIEQKEDVMDSPDGRIVFVDYTRGEVQTTITRSQGAQERMQLSIFDRNSPGLPTDKPKGLIELISVNDRGSIGRIVRTNKPSEPIRNNDLIYSAAWSPNSPQRFALVGKIDMDQDGRDDREDLKRMIRAQGGVIDYDLPPPSVGQETGKLSGLVSWYVLDNRSPIRAPQTKTSDQITEADQQFLEKKSRAITEAQNNGVRPISIERLLSQLGYVFGTAVPGRVEARDEEATRELLNPRGRVATPPPATAPAEPPANP